MDLYFKVLRLDLTSVGLLGAAHLKYRRGEWTRPLEKISDHPRKGGGLWVVRRRAEAASYVRYMLRHHNVRCCIFECRIGKIIFESSCRVKTDKVMLIKEVSS